MAATSADESADESAVRIAYLSGDGELTSHVREYMSNIGDSIATQKFIASIAAVGDTNVGKSWLLSKLGSNFYTKPPKVADLTMTNRIPQTCGIKLHIADLSKTAKAVLLDTEGTGSESIPLESEFASVSKKEYKAAVSEKIQPAAACAINVIIVVSCKDIYGSDVYTDIAMKAASKFSGSFKPLLVLVQNMCNLKPVTHADCEEQFNPTVTTNDFKTSDKNCWKKLKKKYSKILCIRIPSEHYTFPCPELDTEKYITRRSKRSGAPRPVDEKVDIILNGSIIAKTQIQLLREWILEKLSTYSDTGDNSDNGDTLLETSRDEILDTRVHTKMPQLSVAEWLQIFDNEIIPRVQMGSLTH